MVLRVSSLVGTQVRVRAYSPGEETQTDYEALLGAEPGGTRPGKAPERDVWMAIRKP